MQGFLTRSCAIFSLLTFLLVCDMAFASSATLSEREEMYKDQTNAAFVARKQGDWITLVGLARMAHRQQQDPLWERGLIDWAKEIILYQYNFIGAFHLAGYYRDIGSYSQESYWYNMGFQWKAMKKQRHQS